MAKREMNGLDILVNNASALSIEKYPSVKRMELLCKVNLQATIMCIQEFSEMLEKSKGAIITLSPPVRMARLDWINMHPAYTISKYGMTMATLGAATMNVRANSIWPKKMIATDATKLIEDNKIVDNAYTNGRCPSFVAEAILNLSMSNQNASSVFDEDMHSIIPDDNAPMDIFTTEEISVSHH